jgi:hypothetical protein
VYTALTSWQIKWKREEKIRLDGTSSIVVELSCRQYWALRPSVHNVLGQARFLGVAKIHKVSFGLAVGSVPQLHMAACTWTPCLYSRDYPENSPRFVAKAAQPALGPLLAQDFVISSQSQLNRNIAGY